MDHRTQSQLLAAPNEIWCAIFELLVPRHFHLLRREDTLNLLVCVQQEEDRNPECWNRRTNKEDLFMDPRATDPPYLRRLRSPWATRWRCEEVALGLPESQNSGHGSSAMALMTTCKQMLYDVLQTLAHNAVLHVNDLHTLGEFQSGQKLPASDTGQPLRASALEHVLPHVKQLCIDLRLAINSYMTLEFDQCSTHSEIVALVPWIRLPPTVRHFPKLRRLQIWLEHDAPESWTTVHERAFLSPLHSVCKTSELDIQVDLPKLQPKFESPDRHFAEDSVPKPVFTITRRFRQRLHAIQEDEGFLWPKRAAEFPLLHEIVGVEEWGNYTMEEVEDWERSFWQEVKHPYDVWTDHVKCTMAI